MGRKEWTEEEINILKNSQDKTLEEIYKIMPYRSKDSIKTKINRNNYIYKKTKYKNDKEKRDVNIKSSSYYFYKSKGILLNKNEGCHTFSIVEWYNFLVENKITSIPVQVINDKSIVILLKYVIENIINIKTREEIKKITINDFQRNKIYFKTYSLPYELYKVINIIYPDYNIQPWELDMTGIKVFKDEINILNAIKWLLDEANLDIEKIKNINKYIRISVEELFSKYGLSCLLSKFNGYQNLFIWYFNKKGINLTLHDFYHKTSNYWRSKDNCDFQMNKYLSLLFNNDLIHNIKIDLPQFFKKEYLEQTKFKMIPQVITKYKLYPNMYEWINKLHPEFNLKEKDFKVFIGCDNKSRCNSYEEKSIFDFSYNELHIKSMCCIGKNRTDKFYNEIYDETYFPDFKILEHNNFDFDKPLYIEYYGLFVPKNKSEMVQNYIKKAYRKNLHYKSRDDIHFIDLYPEDLKNNFQGVREKLTSFFMQNFNIDILL